MKSELMTDEYFRWIISISPSGVFRYNDGCLEILDKIGKSILRNFPPNIFDKLQAGTRRRGSGAFDSPARSRKNPRNLKRRGGFMKCKTCGKKVFLAFRYLTEFDVDSEDKEKSGIETVTAEAEVCIHFCPEHGIQEIWVENPRPDFSSK